MIKMHVCLFVVLSAMALESSLSRALAQEPQTRDLARLEPDKPVERKISSGQVHIYQLTLRRGQFLRATVEQRGIDIVVTVVGPTGEQIAEVDSPTGNQGEELVEVPATTTGTYRLEVRPWVDPEAEQDPGGRYEIRVNELLSAEQYTAHLAKEQAKLERVIAWVSEHAIPLSTVKPEHGFADLQPLVDVVGDARIVALGEATHGTREFFQLKHRMLEFLVSEMGFTVFAIEAPMSEAFSINEYVLTGKGDPAKALAGLKYWLWNTEEVLDLIKWMRRYNADPRHERKIKFYGFDMESSAPCAAEATLDYLRAVDPEMAAVQPELRLLANPYTALEIFSWQQNQKDASVAAIHDLLKQFDEQRSQYVSLSDSASWALARQHTEIVAQYARVVSRRGTPGGFAVRDSLMAKNVRWILEREGPQARMVLWAHNWHVSTNPPGMGALGMGAYLREEFGPDMVVFGFAFAQGSFRALERPTPSKTGVRPFTVEQAPEGSLGGVLAQTGLQQAAVDLRELPEEGPVAEWWGELHSVRNVGVGYNESSPSDAWAPRVIPNHYDALIFVKSTTPARPNPSGQRIGWTLFETPSNLDFEDGEPGEPPPGWLTGSFVAPWTDASAVQRAFGFDVKTTGDWSYRGEQSGLLARPAGQYCRWAGTLGQRIDATAYRGKRIRLRAAVRTEVSGAHNEAYLWLRVTKAYGFPPTTAFFDDMSDRPITHSEWEMHEIVGEVPFDAEVIDYGLALVGNGRAWIDAVSLEVIDEL